MKVLVYTDLHCSYNSSIMPLYYEDSKYTTRLQMIVDTGKWINEIATNNKVDMIVNCGDTTDSHILRSEEITALSEFFRSIDYNCRHIIITGNHDVLDNNSDFYSTSILSNISNVEVYNKPTKIDDTISVLPYMKSEEITNDMLKSLSNHILFSHIDIKGSHLRSDYIMDSGVDSELLSNYFDLTINGHLHTAEKLNTTTRDVWNIGSVTSGSFNDSNSYIPSVCIINTFTDTIATITRIPNPYAILFRRMNIDSIESLINKINQLDKKFRYILRVNSPYDISDSAREVIGSNKFIIASRVISNISSNSFKRSSNTTKSDIGIRTNIEREFIDFLEKNSECLNYPIDEYIKIVKEII